MSTKSLKTQNVLMANSIAEQFGFAGVGNDGGILKALIDFTDKEDPREKMFRLTALARLLTKLYTSKRERKPFQKITGFEDYYEGLEELVKMTNLFLALGDWRVDAFIHYARIKECNKVYNEFELEALRQLYIEGHGDNTIRKKDEVRSATFVEEQENELKDI